MISATASLELLVDTEKVDPASEDGAQKVGRQSLKMERSQRGTRNFKAVRH